MTLKCRTGKVGGLGAQAGEQVKERGLTCVRIPDQRDTRVTRDRGGRMNFKVNGGNNSILSPRSPGTGDRFAGKDFYPPRQPCRKPDT